MNDGQLEQLELLESTDSVSMRSYEVSLQLLNSCPMLIPAAIAFPQSILDPQLKVRLCDWLQEHWKLMVVVLLVGVFVLVSPHMIKLLGLLFAKGCHGSNCLGGLP